MNTSKFSPKILLMFIAFFALLAISALAQDQVPTPQPDQGGIAAFILGLATKYPWVVTLLTVMGVLRLIMKPAFTFLHEVVKATPSQKDDELLAKVEASPVLKWVLWALDLVCSIKVVNPNAAAKK